MPNSRRPRRIRQRKDASSPDAAQGELWTPNTQGQDTVDTATDCVTQETRTSEVKPRLPVGSSEGAPGRVARRTIQDLLFQEGLKAVRLSEELESLDELQTRLVADFGQNSTETRIRYAQSVLKWFFADGFNGLARRTWLAYRDERVESDILRYLYLAAEPVVGLCVSESLYPLQPGMLIPPTYFDRFLREFFGEEPPARTTARLKSNLMHLGFLERTRGKPDRLRSMVFDKTSLLILIHYLFAPDAPRTIEMQRLLANPFWKYLGCKSEDAVRGVLREADSAGLLGKYVVADQLEQVTTCLTLPEFLRRGARL